ncbi:MAG: hypothetical protein NVSMB14_01280 [Isosphaeraceae bacterium]
MAVTRSAANRRVNAGGMEVSVFIPGAYYQGVTVGGFSDALTGYHVPGPKANVEGSKRQVVSLTDVPDPIQLPHVKIVIEITDAGKTRKEVEVPFNANDSQPMHEAFQNALSTGLIRIIPDEDVMERYPNAWAKYEEKIVWLGEGVRPAKSALEMLKEAEEEGRYVKFAEETTKIEKTRAATMLDEVPPLPPQRRVPPPPPRS